MSSGGRVVRSGRGVRGLLGLLAPGILVAATGVGAGDLATGAFAGSHLGVGVLWAVIVGAFLKFVLNEGLARWQLATSTTFVQGTAEKLGRAVAWVFLPYLVLWSFFVGSALMGACGATLHAMLPVMGDASSGKAVFGIVHSLVGLCIVLLGGFAVFEAVMKVCIGVMFVTVMVTAGALWPGTGAVVTGLVPSSAQLQGEPLTWTVALMGGVGGTLTVLCYGYWIREKGRETVADLKACRIDLAAAYAMTALFGMGMVIIGARVHVEGTGASLIVVLADRLEEPLGPVGRWAFLLGAWGAVFSSLLGVWQAVPYVFADFLARLRGGPASAVDTRSVPYRGYLLAIALVPMLGLFFSFREIQKIYAVVGACFMPLLALALLLLNGRARWVGPALRNRLPTTLVLAGTLGFFGWILWTKL